VKRKPILLCTFSHAVCCDTFELKCFLFWHETDAIRSAYRRKFWWAFGLWAFGLLCRLLRSGKMLPSSLMILVPYPNIGGINLIMGPCCGRWNTCSRCCMPRLLRSTDSICSMLSGGGGGGGGGTRTSPLQTITCFAAATTARLRYRTPGLHTFHKFGLKRLR
jgi:hypothetical protein